MVTLAVGDTWGSWTITGHDKPDGRSLQYTVRCACGKEGVLRPNDVSWGRRKSCQECARPKRAGGLSASVARSQAERRNRG